MNNKLLLLISKFACLVVCVSIVGNVFAQPIKPSKTLDSVLTVACNCYSKQKSFIQDKDQSDSIMSTCLAESVATSMVTISKELGFNFETLTDSAETELGQIIGLKFSEKCPAIMQVASKLDNANVDTGSNGISRGQSIGIVKKIKNDPFSVLSLQDEIGKETSFTWVEYFIGSDEFASNPQKLIGKRVLIFWFTTKIYNGNLNKYVSVKEISGIELK